MSLLNRRMMMQQRESLILELQSITENATWIKGIYIQDGNEIPYTSWEATDYIPVEAYDFIIISSNNTSSSYNAFYDSEKTYIKKIRIDNENNSEGVIVKVPDGACYLRFSNGSRNKKEVEAYGVKAI